MELRPKLPTERGPEKWFLGEVYSDWIIPMSDDTRIRAVYMRCAPGGRTSWHSHAVGQTMHILSGVGLIQTEGGKLMKVRAGDTIYIEPNERHWHGATPDDYVVFLGLWEAPPLDSGIKEAQMQEHVTEEQYSQPAEFWS